MASKKTGPIAKDPNRIPTSQLSTTAKAARLFVQQKDGSVKPLGSKPKSIAPKLPEKVEPMVCPEYNDNLKGCPREKCYYVHACSMCSAGHTAREHRAKANQTRALRDKSTSDAATVEI